MHIVVLGKPDRNHYSASSFLGDGQDLNLLSIQKQTAQKQYSNEDKN